MLSTDLPEARNLLVRGLPREERESLLDACETVELATGAVLCEIDEPVRHVYFPLSVCIALMTKLSGHPPFGIALVGKEGVLGTSLVLGVDETPVRAVVQSGGCALRLGRLNLQRELRDRPRLQMLLNRYLHLQLCQLVQSVACARFHQIEPRLACWLLNTHDRSEKDRLCLTHECLAESLGVRRSGITVAACALAARGLISYSRGAISILDRVGLESRSCECYQVLQSRSLRIFPAAGDIGVASSCHGQRPAA